MISGPNPRFQCFYLACIVLGGIITHLVSEFAGMGAEARVVVFAPRHIYLALAAIACAVLALREISRLRAGASSARDFKRSITIAIQALPLRGWRFYLATAAMQCTVGIASALGEGCFFCGHDVVAAIIGAVCFAFVLALVTRALAARLPSLATALIRFIETPAAGCNRDWPRRPNTAVAAERFAWFSALFNRPPPALQF